MFKSIFAVGSEGLEFTSTGLEFKSKAVSGSRGVGVGVEDGIVATVIGLVSATDFFLHMVERFDRVPVYELLFFG